MPDVFYNLTFVATIAVLIALGLGLRTMMRGDSPNLSQKFMRWRVGLQFLAIVVIMLAIYFRR